MAIVKTLGPLAHNTSDVFLAPAAANVVRDGGERAVDHLRAVVDCLTAGELEMSRLCHSRWPASETDQAGRQPLGHLENNGGDHVSPVAEWGAAHRVVGPAGTEPNCLQSRSGHPRKGRGQGTSQGAGSVAARPEDPRREGTPQIARHDFERERGLPRSTTNFRAPSCCRCQTMTRLP